MILFPTRPLPLCWPTAAVPASPANASADPARPPGIGRTAPDAPPPKKPPRPALPNAPSPLPAHAVLGSARGAPANGPAAPHAAMATPLSSSGGRSATAVAGLRRADGRCLPAPQCIRYCARNLEGYSMTHAPRPRRRRLALVIPVPRTQLHGRNLPPHPQAVAGSWPWLFKFVSKLGLAIQYNTVIGFSLAWSKFCGASALRESLASRMKALLALGCAAGAAGALYRSR